MTDITNYSDKINITGVTGNGFIRYAPQSTKPTSPTSGLNFYANNTSNIAWQLSDGFARSISSTVTADRVYTMQDQSYTVVGRDTIDTLTNKTISAASNTITNLSHTTLTNIGTNTHAQIDTHISASTAHGTTSAIVGVNDNQTLTNKTISASNNTISNLSHTTLTNIGTNTHAQIDTHIGSSTAHGRTSALVGVNDIQTLTNKTINSSSNTVTVTSGTLINTNINLLINQDVRSSSSPSFGGVSFGVVTSVSGGWGTTGVTSTWSGGVTIGYRFSISAPIKVNAIKIQTNCLLGSELREIGIFSDSGTQLIYTMMDNTSPVVSGYYVQSIPTYTLEAGTYRIGAVPIFPDAYNINVVTPTVNSPITGIEYCYSSTSFGSLTYPDITSGSNYLAWGFNFNYTVLSLTSTTTMSAPTLTGNRTISIPDVSGNMLLDVSSNTLTNKTINTSGPNTIQISGTNITSIISQTNPVLSTSSPTFVTPSLTSLKFINSSKDISLRGTNRLAVPTGSTTTVYTVSIPTAGMSYYVITRIVLTNAASGNTTRGSTIFDYSWLVTNDTGSALTVTTLNAGKVEQTFAGAYTNKLVIATATSTTTLNINITSTVGFTVNCSVNYELAQWTP